MKFADCIIWEGEFKRPPHCKAMLATGQASIRPVNPVKLALPLFHRVK